jgi:hypothetical protein
MYALTNMIADGHDVMQALALPSIDKTVNRSIAAGIIHVASLVQSWSKLTLVYRQMVDLLLILIHVENAAAGREYSVRLMPLNIDCNSLSRL